MFSCVFGRFCGLVTPRASVLVPLSFPGFLIFCLDAIRIGALRPVLQRGPRTAETRNSSMLLLFSVKKSAPGLKCDRLLRVLKNFDQTGRSVLVAPLP